MGNSSVGWFKRKWFNLRARRAQKEEMYQLLSENYRMLMEQEGPSRRYHSDDSWCEGGPAICHGMGLLDGSYLLECKEAFEYHYQTGSRVFELDLSLTRDRKTILLHDWERFEQSLPGRPYEAGRVLSKEEFEQAKPLGKYTPLTLERFVELARQYKDARFIISVKSVDQRYDDDVRTMYRELFSVTDAVDPEIKKRYILHVYSFDFLHKAMEEFPFPSIVFRCRLHLHPRSLAKELNRCGVNVVTVSRPVFERKDYCDILHEYGIKIIGCVWNKDAARVHWWRYCGADMLMTPYGEEIRDL